MPRVDTREFCIERGEPIFIRELADRVHDLTGCRRVLALATSHVAFVVVPQRGDEEQLGRRLNDFSAHAAPYATTVVSFKT